MNTVQSPRQNCCEHDHTVCDQKSSLAWDFLGHVVTIGCAGGIIVAIASAAFAQYALAIAGCAFALAALSAVILHRWLTPQPCTISNPQGPPTTQNNEPPEVEQHNEEIPKVENSNLILQLEQNEEVEYPNISEDDEENNDLPETSAKPKNETKETFVSPNSTPKTEKKEEPKEKENINVYETPKVGQNNKSERPAFTPDFDSDIKKLQQPIVSRKLFTEIK